MAYCMIADASLVSNVTVQLNSTFSAWC